MSLPARSAAQHSITVLAFIAASAAAQTPGAVEAGLGAARRTPGSTLPLDPPGTGTSGPSLAGGMLEADAEFGEQRVLVRRAEWEPWSFSLNSEAQWTDNAALASRGGTESWFWRSQVIGGWTNRIAGDWFAEAGVSQSWFLYDKVPEFDFDVLRADAGVLRRLQWLDDAALSFRYSYYRLTESGFGGELYRAHTATLALQKAWQISRGQQLAAAIGSEFGLDAEPVAARRHEHSATLAWSVRWTEKLSTSAAFRAAWQDYSSSSRGDWNFAALAGVHWDFNDWARLSLTASGSWNRSSLSAFDYDALTLGAGLTFTARF